MKYHFALVATVFLAFMPARAGTSASGAASTADARCQIDAGLYRDTAFAGGVAIEREIDRSGTPGHYIYGYSLFFRAPVPDQSGPDVIFTPDGQSERKSIGYDCGITTGAIVGGACVANPSKVFFYAANGDHLNAWDGSIRFDNGVSWPFHFEQVKFDDLKWNRQ